MLAPNFKTPADLKLAPEIFECLVVVLGMLERGEITADEFHMEEWWESRRNGRGQFCGTIGCIGGWTESIGRHRGHAFARHDTDDGFWLGDGCGSLDLLDLFHPRCLAAWSATREEAAQALRNYLTTGLSDWDAVMYPWIFQ